MERNRIFTYDSHDPETVVHFTFQVEPFFRSHTKTDSHAEGNAPLLIRCAM